ncbi:MAG TPA: DUF4082 domain-containing protein [Candidatus Acidoferrum sp.]|nr:DUF4082 domain-containing protein [Candidatus Acidoferrum sp.]
MKTCWVIAAVMAVLVGMPLQSMADLPLVYSVENSGASSNYPAPPLPTFVNCPVIQPLPDPFCWANDPTNKNGTRSTNFSDWEHHRNEFKAQIENYEIGTKPAVALSNIFASYSGGTTPGTSGTLTVRATNGTHTLTLTCAISIPASAAAPYPVVIGMNSPNGSLPASDFSSRGIATVTYLHNQVTTYGNPSLSDPYFQMYGGSPYNFNLNNTGQYSAWAWGVSRIIDGLILVTNTLPVDLQHICVTGCSYAGKMALFSGAFDERVVLTVAQESGGGGDTSWRYSATEPNGTVEGIAQTDHNWFGEQLFQFGGTSVSRLPEDHHLLMAMCAPRALYCTANTDYLWLSNPSAFVCGQACARVYQALGIGDRFGFNVDGGHSHCAFPSDQEPDLHYFLDKFMKDQTSLSQTVRMAPVGYSNIISYARWTAWWGTSNAVFPYTGQLSFSAPSYATEGDGTLVGAGSVRVNPTPTNDNVVVNLTSGNTNKVIVPDTVVIPVGQSNAVFDLTVVDNSILDGDQSSLLTASSPVCNNGTQYRLVIVHDNETTALSVALPASASESAGTLANAGTVTMGAPAGADVTVSLSSSAGSKLTVPSTVVIPKGQTSAVFNVTVVDNSITGGSTNISVTAHVANWTDGSASMTIVYDDPPPDHFVWSTIPSPQLIGEPFAVTITAKNAANNTVDYRLPVTLSGLAPDSTSGTNTILNSPSPEQSATDGYELVLGYSFTPSTNLKVTQVRSYFGDKVSIWNTNGQLLASQNVTNVPGTWADMPLPAPLVLPVGATYLITVHENNVEYFWSQSLPASFADGTINHSFWDYGDVFPTQDNGYQWYFVDLRYATNFVSVPVSPGTTANLSGGSWTGNVTMLQAATNAILQASAAPGHSGTSAPFDVLGTPKLAITISNDSIVLSWPVAASGFNLEQASTLPDWGPCPATPYIVGDRYNATNALGADHLYFRLRKP